MPISQLTAMSVSPKTHITYMTYEIALHIHVHILCAAWQQRSYLLRVFCPLGVPQKGSRGAMGISWAAARTRGPRGPPPSCPARARALRVRVAVRTRAFVDQERWTRPWAMCGRSRRSSFDAK